MARLLLRVFDPVFYLRVVIVVAGIALVVLPYGADLATAALRPVTSDKGDCRVLTVIDGDTVTLVCQEAGVERARLMGFDAPEKFSPKCTGELVAAEKATWALRTMILKASTLSITHFGADRYGRALVTLRLDGEDVARRMIRAGHGRTYGGGLRGSWC